MSTGPNTDLPIVPETAILDEIEESVGLVLWQYFRLIRDWIRASPRDRTNLAPAEVPAWVSAKRKKAAESAPPLAPIFDQFEALLHDDANHVDTDAVASPCRAVAEWAVGIGANKTAALYAGCAAEGDPRNPSLGILAGKFAREAGMMGKAEQHFLKAIRYARQQQRWDEYIRGQLGLGILYMLTKRDGRARRHQARAASTAMREGYEWLAGEAHHDLFQFMTVRGRLKAAAHHARLALECYPKNNPRLPFLAADIAFLLLCHRHYNAAVGILRRFLRIVRKPPQNILGTSMLARALGGSGHFRAFRRTRNRLMKLIDTPNTFEAAAMWHLAEGERALAKWGDATLHARRALDLALSVDDLETAEFARNTVRKVEGGELPRSEPVEMDRSLGELIEDLVQRLESWKPTKRGRPRRHPPHGWKA